MTFTHHQKPTDPHEEKRRWTILLATGGVMAVVVVVWAMLLPIQFRQEDRRVAENRDRWTAPKDDGATDEALRSFRQQVNDLGGRLETMTDSGAAAGASAEGETAPDAATEPSTPADAIREAAAASLEAATGEQGAATQADAPQEAGAATPAETSNANTEPTRP